MLKADEKYRRLDDQLDSSITKFLAATAKNLNAIATIQSKVLRCTDHLTQCSVSAVLVSCYCLYFCSSLSKRANIRAFLKLRAEVLKGNQRVAAIEDDPDFLEGGVLSRIFEDMKEEETEMDEHLGFNGTGEKLWMTYLIGLCFLAL